MACRHERAEVKILSDDGTVFIAGALKNIGIIGVGETLISHVNGVVPVLIQASSESPRQVVVDEKSQNRLGNGNNPIFRKHGCIL